MPFAPGVLFITCAINAPGGIHDSIIAEWGGVYEKLKYHYDEHGGQCVVDSAFSKGQYPFLIKSSRDCVVGSDVTAASLETLRQAAFARQASEWGMRAFQGSFLCPKDRFNFEEMGERQLLLTSVTLLLNLRCRLVRINQILHTYMPHMSVEANHFLL